MEEISINELIGFPLSDIGRAANMVWICFGDDVIKKDSHGRDRIISQYAVHVQCNFRVIYEKKILLASQDIYEPFYENCDDFDWDRSRNSVFDITTEKVLKTIKNKIVKMFEINECGDLTLFLDHDIIIEIVVCSSSQDENWRFFSASDARPHLVMMGNQIEI